MAGKVVLKSYMDLIPKREHFKWLLVFVLFVLAANYFYSYPETLNTLKGINSVSLSFIALIEVFYLLNISLILKTLLNFFNIQMRMRESLGVVSFASMGNYMTFPGGGTFSKAFYLKKQHHFPYHLFISSMSATHLLDLLWISILGVAVMFVIGGSLTTWMVPLTLCFSLVGIVSVGVLLFPLPPKGGSGAVLNVMYNVVDGWRVIRRERGLIVKLSIFLLANHLLWTLELIIAYGAFSVKINLPDALLLGLIATLSTIIKLTPANLGIQEAIVALSSHILGIGFDNGLLVAGLLRIVSVVVILILGGTFGLKLLKVVGKSEPPRPADMHKKA